MTTTMEELRSAAATVQSPELKEAYARRFAMSEQEVAAIEARLHEIVERAKWLGNHRGTTIDQEKAFNQEKLLLEQEEIDLLIKLDPEWNDRQVVTLGYPELASDRYRNGMR